MKKALLTYMRTLAIVVGLVAFPLAASSASAIDVFSGGCNSGGGNTGTTGGAATGAGTGQGAGTSTGTGTSSGNGGTICGAAQQDDFKALMKNIIGVILWVLGIIAVIMIVVGGIRYTTSNGDASQIKAAKDTILYAVIGLIVAIMSYAIVNFVLSSFSK